MSKGLKGPTKLGVDLKQEDIIPAVVVVDDFEGAFHPLSLTRPPALLPMVNVPLIDYTLEGLHAGGVDQVFIYCSCHVDQIKQHIERSRWVKPGVRMAVTVVVAEGCRSVGDVLRDLENKGLIQTDFVLVGADLVTNVNVKQLVEDFKKRKQQSKKAIMTSVYKRAPPDHRTRVAPFDPVLALRTDTQQIVAYQRAGTAQKFRLPLHVLETVSPVGVAGVGKGVVQLRNDLLDCHITVCSTVVSQLMTDNFDYQSIDDLIRGVLVNDEVIDHTLHVSVLEGEDYAASVKGWDTYHAVCGDVMSRYVYPFTPDCCILNDHSDDTRHSFSRRNVYQHRAAKLHHGCTLVRNVSVGSESHVAAGSHLSYSTIGRGCKIGRNVHIEHCHIFDNVIIEDNCHLVDVVIDDRCRIGANTKIKGFVSLGRGINIMSGSVIDSRSYYISNEVMKSLDEAAREKFDIARLVSGGKVAKDAVVLRREENGEVLTHHDRWYQVELGSDAEIDDDTEASSNDGNEGGMMVGELQESDGSDIYYNELIGTLRRAIEENIDIDNVVLEINSVKHAYGVQIHELTMLVTTALLDLPLRTLTEGATSNPTPSTQQYLQTFKSLFKRFQPLFSNYVKSITSEVSALEAIESFAPQNQIILGAVQLIVADLYNWDCLSEEGIMKWWEDGDKSGVGEVRKRLNKFIEWLKTADEEDDSDD